MAYVNYEDKRIHCKALYAGAPSAGKTASLRALWAAIPMDTHSQHALKLSPVSGGDLEFLPFSLGSIQDFEVRIHVYSWPAASLYRTLPRILLSGIDGFVYVADAQIHRLTAGYEALQYFHRCLGEEGLLPADMPHVIQYNKTDLPGLAPREALRLNYNPHQAPEIDTVACEGKGVADGLVILSKSILKRLL